MGFIEKLANAFLGIEEVPENYELHPEKFFCTCGYVDHSAVNADARSKEQKRASGYDNSPIFIEFVSEEPKKLFIDETYHDVMEDGYCQNIHFLMKDLYHIPYGDKLENLDNDPLIFGDEITWTALGKHNGLDFSYGDIIVRFNRISKEYTVAFECTDGMLVYGRRYIVNGFETQSEIMHFLVDLYEELRIACVLRERNEKEKKEKILAEAV